MSLSRGRKIRIGIESMDRFFSRMRANARKLDRDERPAPGLNLSFEDPADFLEVITPARVRLLQKINQKAIPLFALAAALSRNPSAVRRGVTLLQSEHLVKTRGGTHRGQ